MGLKLINLVKSGLDFSILQDLNMGSQIMPWLMTKAHCRVVFKAHCKFEVLQMIKAYDIAKIPLYERR